MSLVFNSNAQKNEVFQNNIKLEVSNLLYGDYSLNYERKMTEKSSLSIRLGYLQPFNHLFNKYEIDFSGKKDGFDTSLEYRFFVLGNKRNELEGMYVAPYLRYAKLNLNFIDEIQITPFSIDFGYSNIGAGLQFGIQGRFGKMSSTNEFWKHLVYDVRILGGGVDRHVLKMTFNRLKDTDDYNYGEIVDYITELFESYPFLTRKLDFNYLNSLRSVKLPVVLPGLRAGFSIGYSF